MSNNDPSNVPIDNPIMPSNHPTTSEETANLSEGEWTSVDEKRKKKTANPLPHDPGDQTATSTQKDHHGKRSAASVHSISSAISKDHPKAKTKQPAGVGESSIRKFFTPQLTTQDQGLNYVPPIPSVNQMVQQTKAISQPFRSRSLTGTSDSISRQSERGKKKYRPKIPPSNKPASLPFQFPTNLPPFPQGPFGMGSLKDPDIDVSPGLLEDPKNEEESPAETPIKFPMPIKKTPSTRAPFSPNLEMNTEPLMEPLIPQVPHESEPYPFSPSRAEDEERMVQVFGRQDAPSAGSSDGTPPYNNISDKITSAEREPEPALADDTEMLMEDIDLACSAPTKPYFWRVDLVVDIPTNTDATLTAAQVSSTTLNVLQTCDNSTILYPYKVSYNRPAINNPAALLTLSDEELEKYVDKGHFARYPMKATPKCRFALFLGSISEIPNLVKQAKELLTPHSVQLWVRALNYPSIGRAGFLVYLHKYHLSDTFENELQLKTKFDLSMKWRRATVKWDLYSTDSEAEAGKRPFIPAAIMIECKEQELSLVRTILTRIYPMIKREDRFTYPCGIRLMFGHSYNPHEFERIQDESFENVKALWHIQKLANMRIRSASVHHIIRSPP